jgi:hypothetical protein
MEIRTLFPLVGNGGRVSHCHISALSLHMLHKPERLLLIAVRHFEVFLRPFYHCDLQSAVLGDL